MQSKATTVADYLKQLPSDRRTLLEAVRKVILANIDRGIEETMNYGMIGYVIPHSIYPAGYHCDPSKPFPYAGLASQKNYCSLYLMPVYNEAEEWFRKEWQRGGKKLNMGKCCLRFNKLEDLDLPVIAKALKRYNIARSLESYEQLIGKRSSGKSTGKPTGGAGKPVAKRKAVAAKASDSGGSSVKSTVARSVGSGKASGAKGVAKKKAKSPSTAAAQPKTAHKKSSLKSRRK